MTTVHDIESAGAVRRAVEVWYAAFGSIVAWMAHLVFEASIVRWTADVPSWRWTLHAGTAVCVLASVVALGLAWRLRIAAGAADESAADDAGQLRFLANVGLLTGVIDLALIVIEGAYAVVLYQPHALH